MLTKIKTYGIIVLLVNKFYKRKYIIERQNKRRRKEVIGDDTNSK